MSTNNAAHTPGPCPEPKRLDRTHWIIGDIARTQVPVGADEATIEANAFVIYEAFSVAHETGLTPRQLAEQRVELLEALCETINQLETLRLGRPVWTIERNNMVSAAIHGGNAAIAKATGGAA